MNKEVTVEKLEKYFRITKMALDKALNAEKSVERLSEAEDFLDMASRYVSDAEHFYNVKKDMVLAYGALNYAHGWLDAGARIGLFKVNDSSLFTVDDNGAV